MYHTGMIPKCYIVEKTITQDGKQNGHWVKAFYHEYDNWVRNFIQHDMEEAYTQFGDNFDLSTGRFLNGAKVSITSYDRAANRFKHEDFSAPTSISFLDTVGHVTVDNGQGTVWDWQIYLQDEKVPDNGHHREFDP